ncbi:MAG TPA: imidazole glycerol phosphate synthase subunit HisH [Chitinophagaceae bacterium]|nr:imidazole glycerol phosphate synthase subunit HisH [Chitinophagaceae bacterium]
MLTIVDYGVGNLASIRNMLKKIGVEALISSKAEDILAADKLILPGVGAFDTCAEKLQQSGLMEALMQKVIKEKTPVLGVCVGMQLLTQGSEEGKLPGLGWIKGKIVRFNQAKLPSSLKIPHMGWREVKLNKESRLFKEMFEEPRFYFVHSYHPVLDNAADALVTADYGYSFVAGMEHDNIIGVQFHPEKSHKFGMKLLENFVKQY